MKETHPQASNKLSVEDMDERLADAARVGDVEALHRIMEDDPLILKKVCLVPFAESPLHVAALAGKLDFVKHMIALMPSLVTHTNLQGLIPLHMASAQGYVDIAKELLKVKQIELDDKVMNQCLMKDNDGFTPLHYAVLNGKIGVIEELISHCAGCVEEATAKGDSVLHLAVKANQFGVMQVLIERLKALGIFECMMEAKDEKGKTVQELAAAKKLFQVVDIVKEANGNTIIVEEDTTTVPVASETNAKITMTEEEAGKFKLDEFQNTVILVATLILSLTYQGLSNPPSTIFKQGTEIQWACLADFSHLFITSLKNCPASIAFFFLLINTIIFLLSIILMVWTLHGRRARLLRLLTVVLTFNYCTLLMAFSPYTAYFAYPLWFLTVIYIVIEPFREFWRKAFHGLQRHISRARW